MKETEQKQGFTATFIGRPVATVIIMIALALFGAMGYVNLPVNNLPMVDFPTISVSATLPGASPETMASAVAAPLEKQFSSISGLEVISSQSFQGSTQITLQFNLERDIDAAALDVQTAIGKAVRQLPKDIQTPSFQKVNPADMPIVMYALTSDTLPLSKLDEYGQTLLGQNISMVSGVASVDVRGSQKYAVRIQLDPAKMAAMGVSVTDVAAAVSAANENLPTGTLWGRDRMTSIETNAQIENAEQFRPVVVGYQNGSLVRLQDIAEVKDDVENNKSAAWFVNKRSIILMVQRQPGSNAVEVADNVRAMVGRLQTQLPGSVKVEMLFDRSESIRESVRDVKITLGLTLVLVILVIFLFLRNASATVIPSFALPLSLVATFAVMYLMGYTLDNLSLMALTLAVGFVVDDAVVMMENVYRHMEMGKSRLRAAIEGAREIEFTIISMTLSLVAVFIPLLLMTGIVGRLFREFAVTISVAILASGFISLTLSPMMCSLVLRTGRGRRHGHGDDAASGANSDSRASADGFTHASGFQPGTPAVPEIPIQAGNRQRAADGNSGARGGRLYTAILRFYERTLAATMRHRAATVVFSIIILAGTVYLFKISPKGFLPNEDIGMISVTTEAAEGTSFDAMMKYQKQVMEIIAADPDVEGFNSSIGVNSWSLSNQGRMFVRLRDRSKRDATADEIIARLRPRVASVSGMKVYLQVPPSIRIGGMSGKAMYQYTLQSTDAEELFESAAKLENELREVPALTDVTSDLALKNPQVIVDIDRDKASSMGITARQVERTLQLAYSSAQISTIYTQTNQYYVLMELLPEYQVDATSLGMLYVKSDTGNLVPLTTIATLRDAVGPMSINHYGQIPAVTISFNLRPGASLSDAVAQIENTSRHVLPASINTTFTGTAQAFQGSQSSLVVLLLLAILVIYMILAILYESFIHPLTILTGLPFAGFGALLVLYIFKLELSLYAYVGIIMLIGVVKKNAIMMIDFAIEAGRNGMSSRDAILQAASVRFRPIMMTTVAALIGTLPIAMGLGAGGEARQPLGMAVVGGLAFSQIVTLYVTPVFYTYFDRIQRSMDKRFGKSGNQPA